MNRIKSIRYYLVLALPIIIISMWGTIKSKPIYAPNKSTTDISYISDITIPSDLSFQSKSAVLYDLDHNTIISSKEADLALAPASLTKLFTTFISIKTLPLSQMATIKSSYESLPQNKLGLAIGDEISVEDMIKSSLIISANDSAEQLASMISIDNINQTILDLGLQESHFINGSGLDHDGHQASAKDIALLTGAIFSEKQMLGIMSKSKDIVKINSQEREITHTHHMLGENRDQLWKVIAGKTGTTANAGECLLTIAQIKQANEWHNIAIILLSSPDRYSETRHILDTISS